MPSSTKYVALWIIELQAFIPSARSQCSSKTCQVELSAHVTSLRKFRCTSCVACVFSSAGLQPSQNQVVGFSQGIRWLGVKGKNHAKVW